MFTYRARFKGEAMYSFGWIPFYSSYENIKDAAGDFLDAMYQEHEHEIVPGRRFEVQQIRPEVTKTQVFTIGFSGVTGVYTIFEEV